MKQGDFLNSMGIEYRIDHLFQLNKDKEELDTLKSQYNRLVSEEEMGKSYKFMYIGRGKIRRGLLSF